MTNPDRTAENFNMLHVSKEPTMRAVVCDAPDEAMNGVSLRRIACPQPAKGQVRVRVEAASLNPVDWKLATGFAPWWQGTGAHVVGLDGAGVIDSVGPDVTGWKAGDRVVWH